jgi:aryl-alcohol dehydrogenase-like predicted oxidoreductase
MKQRVLGRTNLAVSELALGGLFVSEYGGAFEQGRAAVRRALELGINYIDTAPGYLNSEEVLGKALEGVTQPLILSTKLGGRPQPFEPQNRDCLMRSVEESLRLLKRDRIDILMIHEPDRQGQYAWWTDLERVHGPVLEVLADLRRQGVIRFTGLGGTTAYEIARVMATGLFDVVLTAFNYNVIWREAEHEILPLAKRLNMGVIIGSPLQQGSLAKRFDAEVNDPKRCRWLSKPRREQFQALYRYLDEIALPLPEVAMRFTISNPDISCVLSGARSAEEVERNAAAIGKGPLPAEVLARLKAIANLVPFRPYEEPWGLPFQTDTILKLGHA